MLRKGKACSSNIKTLVKQSISTLLWMYKCYLELIHDQVFVFHVYLKEKITSCLICAVLRASTVALRIYQDIQLPALIKM